jgi:2'-5' RNA ligase
MAKALLIEELHLTVFAPGGLPEAEYEAIRRTLDAVRFQADLRRAVRDVLRQYPALSKTRVMITR